MIKSREIIKRPRNPSTFLTLSSFTKGQLHKGVLNYCNTDSNNFALIAIVSFDFEML